MPHVEQKFLTLPEHLSSPPVFSGSFVARYLVFCVMFCRLLFVLFLLAIVLYILLRFTTSGYTFGNFKLFLLDSCQFTEAVNVLFIFIFTYQLLCNAVNLSSDFSWSIEPYYKSFSLLHHLLYYVWQTYQWLYNLYQWLSPLDFVYQMTMSIKHQQPL